MKILILGGFLGSGKTSLLLHLAKYLVCKETDYHSQVKVAIIENEIGKISIDDKVMKNAGFKVDNLFSGCACCSLAGELVSSIKKIKKQLNPKWLIIEATGVAYPGSMKKAILQDMGVDSYIFTVVDAKRWNKLVNAMETFVSGQLEDSSKVLLNKIDLVSSGEINQVEKSILSYNNKIDVIRVSAKEEVPDELWDKLVNELGDLYEYK